MQHRFVGIDVGAETVKVAELTRTGETLQWTGRRIVEHQKQPRQVLRELLETVGWAGLGGAAASGRFGKLLQIPQVPTKQAQVAGFRFLRGPSAATVVSIGAHGFSVLELRPSGVEVFRQNSRCSQGTGNFLRQLVERFDLSVQQADGLCSDERDPAPLSGRCPVILKSDMTHLANSGENRSRILAGLFDAVCENVQVLIKPRVCPPDLVLVGGVSRSARVAATFSSYAEQHGMRLLQLEDDAALFLEALGGAVLAAAEPAPVPSADQVLAPAQAAELEQFPALSGFLSRIRRLPRPRGVAAAHGPRRLVLGFDMGSTGSKLVALDGDTGEAVWEGYVSTNGDPVGAAQTLMRRFVEGPAAAHQVVACAATGSGREIVGSLLATCYGSERVYVLNEIAAHAEGSLSFDSRVDTIFEIGGQDAKYIRLSQGRVVDAAMNEACSAGTGSFIEEQGRRFSGIQEVQHLGREALGADCGVSLGQHCSVFMAEIVDEAIAAGLGSRSILAGIYDSIIQNYLNRVKGNRPVGRVIFCQGMPFAADALAAAVVRQTGAEVIIPPNPGTVGALGIARLARRELPLDEPEPLAPERFLGATVTARDQFICTSDKGCGGSPNYCRIDRLTTVVDGSRQRFTWGGGCSLWDRGTRRRKLPDGAPDPFKEREAMVARLVEELAPRGGAQIVALTDEFQLKELFPFFATFISGLGFDLVVRRCPGQSALKRGIDEANVPFCAPMQQFHGLAGEIAGDRPDFLFLPMLRGIGRAGEEPAATVCPIVQACPDLLRADLGEEGAAMIISPVIDVGPGNLSSREFYSSCRAVARELGVRGRNWRRAFDHALAVQAAFDSQCAAIGRRALSFCREHNIVPVVILGRSYTIYNKVLNSNVPAITREQGAMAIPVDCYPVDTEVPVFHAMYWGYGQRNLRAAHQIRRSPGQYALWCSNYACGPDSFNLSFFAYIMEGKPFSIIETDGHSGDAGTKTRVEAFLHCVRQDLERRSAPVLPRSFKAIEVNKALLPDIMHRGERVLVPAMGPPAAVLAACLRGLGLVAEAVPEPTRDTLRLGRRYTTGKECVPMIITLGSLLERLQRDGGNGERYVFFMPATCGPCRFGVYHVLHKVILERLGWQDRVRVWSPLDEDYFEGAPAGFSVLAFAGFCANDLLLAACHDVRPVESHQGAANAIYERFHQELLQLLERCGDGGGLGIAEALAQVASGRLFGIRSLLRRAATDYAAIRTGRKLPKVAVVGEIYLRCDPFANDHIINKLEQRGLRAHLAPFTEWLDYVDLNNRLQGRSGGLGGRLSTSVRQRILSITHMVMAPALGWPERTRAADSVAAAFPYIRKELAGEAILTLGSPVHEWREGAIHGVVNVGPLECMPSKIAEAQLFHVAEQEHLASLTLNLIGDPICQDQVDTFAFEVHRRFAGRG